ncbi:MAG: amino acid adenylation domain-containing protein [Lachnospiraceae bacterium]|nr:amino acid adenylation domain-containing protein [Lachnospiraceae bacterium]
MYYNILQYLERNTKLYPDKIALEDDKRSISYFEYENKAKIIATFLLDKIGTTRNQPIAVLIDRNILSIVAFMGVVYSGNFYVPVDASMPKERVELIYDTLRPTLIIDARNQNEMSNDIHGIYRIEEILLHTQINEKELLNIRESAIDTDPLYAIFTSGSTGIPKGVAVSHKSVIDLVEAFYDTFSFDDCVVIGNQAPFDFDVSVKDIYNALKCGAVLEVLPKKLFKMPKLLIEYLGEKKINTLIWAVSALRIVADFKTLDSVDSPDLRYVMFSGEVMPVKVLNYWKKYVPKARYVNLYGPTEITCNCTYYEIKKDFENDEFLPIGKAFVNSRVMLLDEERNLIDTDNKLGEICVSGTCLALGYWNNAEKTDEAFIQNPLITAYGSKIYATGDMGYYDNDGNIIFKSRKDYQIKHMGHRIELGEIEVALNSIPFLIISCCLYDSKSEKIVCFYQSDKECKKEIVAELSKKLPKYMWPNVYIHYTDMPMNKNGKIDRVALGEQLLKIKA